MLTTIRAFLHDESGAAAIEYALLVTLISLVTITLASLGVSLDDLFSAVSSELANQSATGPGGVPPPSEG